MRATIRLCIAEKGNIMRDFARLTALGARLYQLGKDVELARGKLQRLSERGEANDSARLRAARERFNACCDAWNAAEEEYLKEREACLAKDEG